MERWNIKVTKKENFTNFCTVYDKDRTKISNNLSKKICNGFQYNTEASMFQVSFFPDE